jgi:hypothetical protein
MASDYIRQATKEDLPMMLDMIDRFYAAANLDIPLNKEAVASNMGRLAGIGGMYVCDTGFIGFQMSQIWYSGDPVGQVVMVWSDKPGTGVKLLKFAAKKAAKMGAKYFQCNSLLSLEPEKLEKVLSRLEYDRIEHVYMRAL